MAVPWQELRYDPVRSSLNSLQRAVGRRGEMWVDHQVVQDLAGRPISILCELINRDERRFHRIWCGILQNREVPFQKSLGSISDILRPTIAHTPNSGE